MLNLLSYEVHKSVFFYLFLIFPESLKKSSIFLQMLNLLSYAVHKSVFFGLIYFFATIAKKTLKSTAYVLRFIGCQSSKFLVLSGTSFIHCIVTLQRKLRQGWDRVQLGLPIRTLSQPYTNPIPTLSQPPLQYEQKQTEFSRYAFKKVLQHHAVFHPSEKPGKGSQLLNMRESLKGLKSPDKPGSTLRFGLKGSGFRIRSCIISAYYCQI